MVPRYPLRPLTHSGRVLVCVMAAVFAALLLVAWSPIPADADVDSADDAGPVFTCAPMLR